MVPETVEKRHCPGVQLQRGCIVRAHGRCVGLGVQWRATSLWRAVEREYTPLGSLAGGWLEVRDSRPVVTHHAVSSAFRAARFGLVALIQTGGGLSTVHLLGLPARSWLYTREDRGASRLYGQTYLDFADSTVAASRTGLPLPSNLVRASAPAYHDWRNGRPFFPDIHTLRAMLA